MSIYVWSTGQKKRCLEMRQIKCRKKGNQINANISKIHTSNLQPKCNEGLLYFVYCFCCGLGLAATIMNINWLTALD